MNSQRTDEQKQAYARVLESSAHAERRLKSFLAASNGAGAAAILTVLGGYISVSPPKLIPLILTALLTIFLCGLFLSLFAMIMDAIIMKQVVESVKKWTAEEEDRACFKLKQLVRSMAFWTAVLCLLIGAVLGLFQIWRFTDFAAAFLLSPSVTS